MLDQRARPPPVDEVQKAVSDAMFKGDLTLDTLKELTKAEATEAENRVRGMVTEEGTPVPMRAWTWQVSAA